MNFHATRRKLGAGALGAALLVSAGCAETVLVGQLDDSELQDPQVLPLAGLGISREINDLVHANMEQYLVGGYTDEIAFGGVSGAERRWAIGDVRGRENAGTYEQIHEAVWASYKVVDLAYGLFGVTEEFTANPVVARAYLSAGQMERIMGDFFCEITYQYGPGGGFNLAQLEEYAEGVGINEAYEAGTILGKDTVYKRAQYAFEQAVEWADRAIAGGVPPTAEDPEFFDPQIVKDAAIAGLAQVHHALWSYGVDPAANRAAALSYAGQIPTDFEELWTTDQDTRNNDNWDLSWNNDDVSFWADTILGEVWGSAVARHVEPGDTRGGVEVCQDFINKAGPTEADIYFRSNVGNTGNTGCTPDPAWSNLSINRDMELRSLPRWLLRQQFDPFYPMIAVSGRDMRLIEAEFAMLDGNLGLFTSKINEVRSFYGASPITQPATVGELEYPNEVDDAYSILDREILLTGNGYGRRLFHLDRWEHPFIRDNNATHPEWRDGIEAQGAGYQRASCFPLPQRECDTNVAIECPVL